MCFSIEIFSIKLLPFKENLLQFIVSFVLLFLRGETMAVEKEEMRRKEINSLTKKMEFMENSL